MIIRPGSHLHSPAREVHTNSHLYPKLDRTARGRKAERAAAAYLAERGYRVVAVNQRTPVGEIDIVCSDGSILVIVEVKARSSQACGSGLEAVGPAKTRRLRTASLWWLADRGLLDSDIRFDVVCVQLDHQGSPCGIKHLEDANEGDW